MKNMLLFKILGKVSLTFLWFFVSFGVKAGNPSLVKSQYVLNGPDWSFRENKGQLRDENQKQLNNITYYGKQGGVNIYCKAGMIGFVFTKTEKDAKISEATGKSSELGFAGLADKKGLNAKTIDNRQLTINRADLVLLGSNLNAEITASNKQEYYENYYNMGDANHGITNVHTYKTITYKNIYPNIDMVLEAKPNSMEYSFIIRPGGKVGDIQLQWNGLDNIKKLENGGIEYAFASSVGAIGGSPNGWLPNNKEGDQRVAPTFTESAPVSYQTTSKEGFRKPDCQLAINSKLICHGSRISFSVGSYDKTKTLVIDPDLVWGTYYGPYWGVVNEGVAIDDTGNVYLLGNADGSLGSHTGTVLVKYNSSGKLLWYTYYIGNNYTMGAGIAIGDSAKVYLVGYTPSISGISTKGAYQTSLAGVDNAYLAKFNPNGTISWATYFGGNNITQATGITTDDSENVYISGITTSTKGLASSGEYQTYLRGTQNTFLAKFTPSGNLSWSTYYGGNNTEVCNGVAADDSTVYITGWTSSTSGIASSGAYQTSLSGNYDAFLARFTKSGKLSWGTFYGGNGYAIGNGLAIGDSGSIDIVGNTTSDSGITTPNSYQKLYAGGTDVFLAKFTFSGVKRWATYYGGNEADAGYSIVTDGSKNIYLAGNSFSDSGISTCCVYKTTNSGGPDAVLAKFTPDGNLSWATYYGGTGSDGAYSIALDTFGNVYITGNTFGSNGIATSGAYQTYNGGGYGCCGGPNVFLAKFKLGKLYKNDACIYSLEGTSIYFCTDSQTANEAITVQLRNYGNDLLTSDSIYWSINGKAQTPINWTGSIKTDSIATITLGNYTFSSPSINAIKIISTKPNGVIDSSKGNNTVNFNFNFNISPKINAGKNSALCIGDSALIGSKNVVGNSYSWSSYPMGFNDTLSDMMVKPTVTTTYFLTEQINSNGCSSSDSVVITVNPVPAPNAGSSRAICNGFFTTIGSNTVFGDTYSWTSDPYGFIDTSSAPVVKPVATTTYYLTENITATGCTKSDSVIIKVNPVPNANTGSNTALCFGDSDKLGSLPINGNSYLWISNPSGFNSTISNPLVIPTITTTYYLIETIISTGCSKSDSVVVAALAPQPGSDSISACFGNSIKLGRTPFKNCTYYWTDATHNKFFSSDTNPVLTINFYSNKFYQAVITDTLYGCTAIYSTSIKVNPLPNASFTKSISGTSVKFSPFDTSLSSYRWAFGDGKTDTSINPTHLYSTYGAYTVHLVVKNNNGCNNSDSSIITIKAVNANFSVNDTSCTSTPISFSDSSKSNSCGTINNWLWAFGDGDTSSSQNPIHTYTSAGVFSVKLTVFSSGGCTDSFSKTIFVDSTCVWPGDANNNKVVEITDVLNIGIAYNDSGAKRAYPNNLWTGQYCDNWGKTFATGGDYKHADCNGDGVVDSLDMIAVAANWGDFHLKTGSANIGSPSDPPFYLKFSKSTYNTGDSVSADMVLGDSSKTLSNIYGFAFAYNYNPAFVQDKTVKVNFTNSWFGTPGKDMISYVHNDTISGQLDVAVTRKDHKNVSGLGKIGNISFVTENTIAGKTVALTPALAKLISFQETNIPVYLGTDSFVAGALTGIVPASNNIEGISIYPNPASQTLNIELGSNIINSITIFDATGGVNFSKVLNFGKVGEISIPVSNLQAGIYFIKLNMENGSYMAKFMKE